MEEISILFISHPLHADVTKVRVRGALQPACLAQLERDLQALYSEGPPKKVVFDLSDTPLISSGGWSLFLDCRKQLKEKGGELLLAAMRPEVLETFELLGFNKTFRSFPTVDQALVQGRGMKPIPSLSMDSPA